MIGRAVTNDNEEKKKKKKNSEEHGVTWGQLPTVRTIYLVFLLCAQKNKTRANKIHSNCYTQKQYTKNRQKYI